MPDPFNKAKMTGDMHPPEVESDLPLEEGSAQAAGVSGTRSNRSRAAELKIGKPTRGVKKAGLLKDSDDAQPQRAEDDPDSGRGTGGHRG